MVVAPGWANRRRLFRRAGRLGGTAPHHRGWLVIAPHPDDETLGAGGLIAALSATDVSVTVAFLTDGSGSHVGAPGWSARRVAATRAGEAGVALRRLGHHAAPVMLGWRDAVPFAPGDPGFEAGVRRLAAIMRRRGLRRIAATWEGDPHCDHEAAARLATAVGRRLHLPVRFYCVWGWTVPDMEQRLRGWRAAALPVARWRGAQRRALDAHATQLGGRIAGAADRFVLPRPMRRLVDATHTIFVWPRHAA